MLYIRDNFEQTLNFVLLTSNRDASTRATQSLGTEGKKNVPVDARHFFRLFLQISKPYLDTPSPKFRFDDAFEIVDSPPTIIVRFSIPKFPAANENAILHLMGNLR